MASNDPSPNIPIDQGKKDTQPESGDGLKKSQDSTAEQTGTSGTAPQLPSGDPPVKPQDEIERIEPLSDPSSPKQTSTPADPSSSSRNETDSGPIESEKSCCTFGMALTFVVAISLTMYNTLKYLMPEVYFFCFSLACYTPFMKLVKRGRWAKEPTALIEEERKRIARIEKERKRNVYNDAPAEEHGIMEGNPMEPPCPRPQPPPPKVQVYQADIHRVDHPSSSSGAEGGEPQKGDMYQSSRPSTSGIMTSVDIFVEDQEDSLTDS